MEDNQLTECTIEKDVESAITELTYKLIKSGSEDVQAEVLAHVKKAMYKVTLDYTEKNRSESAAILGINRGGFGRSAKEFGLI